MAGHRTISQLLKEVYSRQTYTQTIPSCPVVVKAYDRTITSRHIDINHRDRTMPPAALARDATSWRQPEKNR